MKPKILVPVLFECCRIVKGYSRSLICDIQRSSFRFIPNEIADMLIETKGMTVEQIKRKYNNEFDQIIQENFDLLEMEEILFFTENPEWFTTLNLEWDEPTELTNAIIDIDPEHKFDFASIWDQLGELGCEHIQIRIYKKIEIELLESILCSIGGKRIISVELILPFNEGIHEQDWLKFLLNQPRIVSIICHSSPDNKLVQRNPNYFGDLYFMKEILTGNKHCGKIGPGIYSINIKTFTESLSHNSCLNRKISIDLDGSIKNCPSMAESFGNIQETKLKEVLANSNFKKFWNIAKDQIDICKECEFRYICTDCRAFIEKPNDKYSKPLKCGYNPYTCEWEDWSTSPLKQQAIDFFGFRNILPEFKK